MSNALAITAVTSTLRSLLTNVVNALPGTSVTCLPPNDAREGTPNQVNLFLYRSEIAESLRNMDLPWHVKQGESGHPPLALRLQYLLTAYGQGDDEVRAHQVLGMAMAGLHDHPVLGAAEIEAATNATFPTSDLHLQVERIRVTHLPLSLDDISKLWTGFQTPYRISTAYEVAVVLIESSRATKTPLPVLARGPGDTGIVSQPDLVPPYPGLATLELPTASHGAVLGDVISLSGYHLDGDLVQVRFSHPGLTNPIELAADPGADSTRVQVTIPADQPESWPVGFYGLSVLVTNGTEQRVTNELPLPLIPKIVAVTPANASTAPALDLRIDCLPRLIEEQGISCLFGDREIALAHIPDPVNPADPSELHFSLENPPVGVHLIRVRVDGNDSNPIDYSTQPPQFDPDQKVTISP